MHEHDTTSLQARSRSSVTLHSTSTSVGYKQERVCLHRPKLSLVTPIYQTTYLLSWARKAKEKRTENIRKKQKESRRQNKKRIKKRKDTRIRKKRKNHSNRGFAAPLFRSNQKPSGRGKPRNARVMSQTRLYAPLQSARYTIRAEVAEIFPANLIKQKHLSLIHFS